MSESSTIAVLRPTFAGAAISTFGLADFDASALLNSGPRALTQHVGRFIYELPRTPPFDGIRFLSRYGADLQLWAIFERSDDEHLSRHLSAISKELIDPDTPDVVRALRHHSLTVG